MNSRKEYSNKYTKYRKTLLSHAEGSVLETGVGTGINLVNYKSHVNEFIGVDWSMNMLMQAFNNLNDLKHEN